MAEFEDRRYGWAIRHVLAGFAPKEAAFSYTVGLTAMGHPEVVVTGLPSEHAHTFLNNVGADVRETVSVSRLGTARKS